MFEWMPVLCGAVLGLLHRRAYIGQRTLLCLGVLAACIVSAASGELFGESLFILVDVALVVAGVIAIRMLAAFPKARLALREVRAAYGRTALPTHTTLRIHTTLPVRSPHLRNTRSRIPARQIHHDESL